MRVFFSSSSIPRERWWMKHVSTFHITCVWADPHPCYRVRSKMRLINHTAQWSGWGEFPDANIQNILISNFQPNILFPLSSLWIRGGMAQSQWPSLNHLLVIPYNHCDWCRNKWIKTVIRRPTTGGSIERTTSEKENIYERGRNPAPSLLLHGVYWL